MLEGCYVEHIGRLPRYAKKVELPTVSLLRVSTSSAELILRCVPVSRLPSPIQTMELYAGFLGVESSSWPAKKGTILVNNGFKRAMLINLTLAYTYPPFFWKKSTARRWWWRRWRCYGVEHFHVDPGRRCAGSVSRNIAPSVVVFVCGGSALEQGKLSTIGCAPNLLCLWTLGFLDVVRRCVFLSLIDGHKGWW